VRTSVVASDSVVLRDAVVVEMEEMYANWNYPTNILVGPGRVNEIGTLCASQGIKAPLVVTDPGIAMLPMSGQLLAACEAAGLNSVMFSNIKANPTGQNVNDGVAAFLGGHHDAVIALGGGSALDAGKAIALIAQQSCSLWDLEDIGDNHQNADPQKIAPIVAVPTTAGTGSEVGRAGLIVNEAERRKVIIFHPKMMPMSVILDPELTVGLPPQMTAATGMDALSHSLEAWCSPGFHPMAEGIALEGIRLVYDNIERVVTDGQDLKARLNMLVASMMGATAFQRGLGAMHALAHPLGAVYDAHHGLLNAVLMPYVLVANGAVINARIAKLAGYIGLTPSFDAFLDWVLALRQKIGIPHTLAEFIVRDAIFDRIGEMAVADPSAGGNPILFSASEYQRVLLNAFEGRL
jgi:alcohol dehydrogenase class IV